MYLEDLSLLDYHPGPCDADAWRCPLLAVGWLEHPRPFTTGGVPAGWVERLESLLEASREQYGPYHFRGLHHCDLCQPPRREAAGETVSYVNVWVPGDGVVYVAPGLMGHYVREHGYLPPAEFVEAVLGCAEPGTAEYRAALGVANGGEQPPLLAGEEYEEDFARRYPMLRRKKPPEE